VTLTTNELRELTVIGRMPEGNALVAILERRHDQTLERLLNASGEDVYRAQGYLRAIQELLRDIKEARQRLARVN
jgi:hypothetical protein